MKFPLHGRMARTFLALGSTTFLTSLALPGLASAQTAAEPPQDQADTGSALGDIIVTATRSAQSVQKVPISMQALGTETLAARQVVSFTDYVNMLPSVSFATLGPGRSEVFFRGISVDGGDFPTVGTYLDDIPITTAGRMPDVHIYDVQRVEALSGPQGTLFGSSSLAGTLRIITNKPDTSKFEAGYDVQATKYGSGGPGHMFEGFMNVPVTDRVAVRMMGFYRKDGGYIDNTPGTVTYTLGDDDPTTNYTINNSKFVRKDYNPVKEYGGRLMVGIELNDNWTITPAITAQYLDAQGGFNYDPDVGDLKVHDYNPTYLKDKWYQAALTIEGKVGDFDVVSATGYFRRHVKNANDYTYYTVSYDARGYADYLKFLDASGNYIDPTQQYYGDNKYKKFTQELRISSPKDWFLHFTAGVFYQYQKNEINSDYYIAGLSDVAYLTDADGNYINNGYKPVKRDAFYLTERDQTYKDYAAFAEGTIDITSKLALTGGIRVFKAKNLVYGFGGIMSSAERVGCTVPFPDERLTCINTNLPYKESGETHKVGLTWQIDNNRMVYATYSTGFRPGGGNRLAGAQPFKSDTLSNYEVGFKTTWNGNFRINGAFYFESWDGIQYGVVPAGFQGAGVTLNAGKAHVYGVEMDAEWKIGHLTLATSGAYNNAKLASNFCNLDPATRVTQLASCTEDFEIAARKGTRLPRQPRLKMQGSARYDLPLGNDLNAYFQGVAYYQSSSTSDLDEYKNALLGNTKGFVSVDFSTGLRYDKTTVELFLQNAFDKRGILNRNTFCSIEVCSDSARAYPIKPRYFGIKFGQRF